MKANAKKHKLAKRASRWGRAWKMAGEAFDLVRTFDKKSDRAKIFGSPAHAGGPGTKYAQLAAV